MCQLRTSDTSQRCGKRTPIPARAAIGGLNLYPNLPLPTALYLYLLASEGPHPGLSSNPTSSMRPSPPTATPLPHSLSLCGLPRKKEVHPLYQESLKALVSSKDRDLGPAPFQDARSTCAQWDPEVGPSKKGWRAEKSWSCTQLSPHSAPMAQKLQALRHWMVTLSCPSPLQFSKHAFLHVAIFVWGNVWITTE